MHLQDAVLLSVCTCSPHLWATRTSRAAVVLLQTRSSQVLLARRSFLQRDPEEQCRFASPSFQLPTHIQQRD